MFTNRFRPSFDDGYPPYRAHGHGPRGGHGSGPRGGPGPWGRPSGPRRVLPLLAAALLARAVLQRAPRDHEGRRGPWGRGWGDWQAPRDHGRDFGGPRGHGDHGHEHGRGRRHNHGHEHAPEGGRDVRAEIGGLIALLRDARRRGAPSADQVRQVREVLADARTRIAAILVESPSPRDIV